MAVINTNYFVYWNRSYPYPTCTSGTCWIMTGVQMDEIYPQREPGYNGFISFQRTVCNPGVPCEVDRSTCVGLLNNSYTRVR